MINNKEPLLAEAIDYDDNFTYAFPPGGVYRRLFFSCFYNFFIVKVKIAETKKSRPYAGTGFYKGLIQRMAYFSTVLWQCLHSS